MIDLVLFCAGAAAGYLFSSLSESILHDFVSDAPVSRVARWKKHPKIFRIFLNTYFSHHVIHHFKTYRKNHVTQFESLQERETLTKKLLERGRHGEIIVKGNFSTRIHGEGAVVFALPGVVVGLAVSMVAPLSMAIGCGIALSLPTLFSYFVHPYLHLRFDDGQASAPVLLAWVLRTKYMRLVYRNHFMHHRYGGTSNFNLVLGADYLRGHIRRPSAEDLVAMREVGMPLG